MTLIRSDQSLSRVRLLATPWIAARQASLSITNSRSSLRLTSIESVMPSSQPWVYMCSPSWTLLPPPLCINSKFMAPPLQLFSSISLYSFYLHIATSFTLWIIKCFVTVEIYLQNSLVATCQSLVIIFSLYFGIRYCRKKKIWGCYDAHILWLIPF